MWVGMFQLKAPTGNELRMATKSAIGVFNRLIGGVGLRFTLIVFLLISALTRQTRLK
jgi:hypothetical protein